VKKEIQIHPLYIFN